MNKKFEITGIFYKSLLDTKYPAFVLQQPNDEKETFLYLYTTDKSKSYAEKIQPGDEVTVTFTISSRERNGFWNSYNNAISISKGKPVVKTGLGLDKPEVKEVVNKLDLAPEEDDLPF